MTKSISQKMTLNLVISITGRLERTDTYLTHFKYEVN